VALGLDEKGFFLVSLTHDTNMVSMSLSELKEGDIEISTVVQDHTAGLICL